MNTGDRLASQVCSAQVMIIRSSTTVELTCGGLPMVALEQVPEPLRPIGVGLDGGALLGKRYTAESDDTFELLVTQAGTGSLADGQTPLVLKEAKALPSSD